MSFLHKSSHSGRNILSEFDPHLAHWIQQLITKLRGLNFQFSGILNQTEDKKNNKRRTNKTFGQQIREN